MVTFNYRLGVFGFLSTGDSVIPGNWGLKDQQFALKWVYKNIHLFGGDKEQIRLYGQGAGGASITYHLLNKESRQYFYGAIISSGTALNTQSFQRTPRDYAFELADLLNISYTNGTKNSKELLEALRNMSAKLIVEAGNKLLGEEFYAWQTLNGYKFAPCIEPAIEGAFLTERMFDSFGNVEENIEMPILMGMNSAEGLGVTLST